MKITALKDSILGAEVNHFDCADFGAADIIRLREALHRHQLLVFRAQQLEPSEEVAFYRALDPDGTGVWRDQVNNPWEVYKVQQGNTAGTWQIPSEPAVLVLGKGRIDHYGLEVTLGGERGAYGRDRGSQVLGGGALQWHIDGTFYGHAPCNYTQMRCIEAPEGDGHWLVYEDGSGERLWCAAGATAFASGRQAFDLLDDAGRDECLQTRVHYAANPFQASYALGNSGDGLRISEPEAEAAYAGGHDRPGAPIDDPQAQVYPAVWTCSLTGQQALMLQPRCMHALEQRDEAGNRFLGVVESRLRAAEWMRPAIRPEYVYVHAWQAGDLVIWHNRSVWHSATGGLSAGDRRVMHLTAFNGSDAPRCQTGPEAAD